MKPDTFSGLLEKQLEKQRAKQAKNRRAIAAAVREIQARNNAPEDEGGNRRDCASEWSH